MAIEIVDFPIENGDKLFMGMSENGVYPQWNSHLVGIMISKTIGCRGTQHFQTKPYKLPFNQQNHGTSEINHEDPMEYTILVHILYEYTRFLHPPKR